MNKNCMNKSIPIKEKDISFLNACILGDWHIQKSGRISFCSQELDFMYSVYKYNRLKYIFNNHMRFDAKLDKRTNKIYYSNNSCSLTTLEIKELRKKFYRKNKVIPDDIVFDEEFISILYMDDGYSTLYKNSLTLGFATNDFDKIDVIKIARMIENSLNLPLKLNIYEDKKDRYKIKTSTINALKIIYCSKRYSEFYGFKSLKIIKAMKNINNSKKLKNAFSTINDKNFFDNSFIYSKEFNFLHKTINKINKNNISQNKYTTVKIPDLERFEWYN